MAVAIVQNSGKQYLDNVTGTVTYTFGGALTAGNRVLIAMVSWTAEPSAITCGGAGNAATKRAETAGGDSVKMALWDTAVIGASPTGVISFTVGAGSYHTFTAIEASGLASGTAFDQKTEGTTGVGTALTITSPTLSQADEFVIAILGHDDGGNITITAPGAPWTTLFNEPDGASHESGIAQYQSVAATTAVTSTATLASSRRWAAVIGTWKIAAGGGGSATLTAAQGSYTHTGQAVALTRGLKEVCAQGSYTHTGQAVTFRLGKLIALAQGSYAHTGQAVALKRSLRLACGQGSYTHTGQAMVGHRNVTIVCEQATSTQDEDGLGPNLLWGHRLAAGQGSYVHAGQAVTLTKSGSSLACAQGSYAHTGQAVSLKWGHILPAAQGSYAHTGQGVTLTKTGALTLLAGQGSYVHTGQDLATRWAHRLVLAAGSYAHTGQSVGLTRGILLALGSGTYSLTGGTLNTLVNRRIVATYGAYVHSGRPVSLVYSGDPIPPPVAAATSMGRKFRTRGRR